MTLSIKKRFLYLFISLLLLMTTITVSKIYFEAKRQIQEIFDAELVQEAYLLLNITLVEFHELMESPQGFDALKIRSSIINNMHKYQKRVVFQVWNANDVLIVRSDKAPDEPMMDVDGVFIDKTVNDKLWRVFSFFDEQSQVRIQIAQQYQRRNTLIGIILNQLVSSTIILLPLFIIVIYFSVSQALLPFNKITQDIKQRAINSLEPISLSKVPEEIHSIVTALNSLFKRLQVAIDDIVVFTSNAAHELRTPLTTQKLHAQIAMETPDAATRNEALSEVMSGVTKSTQIVEQLLMLARLDPETEVQQHDTSDLAQLTQETIGELVPLALEKNIDISLEADKAFNILGKPSLLSVLVRNLVENAIRYTPEHGKVDVSIVDNTDNGQHEIRLRIADSGPGIPAQERENVFKRFYRGESSNAVEGTGLGLAMVDRIVQIHRATISLSESKYQGLQVDVVFHAIKT